MVDFVLVVFVLVYLGMFLGEIPGLALDRTGIAVLGAIALVVGRDLSLQAAWEAVDVSTIGLLGALMVVSAQLRLGGFYTFLTRRLAAVNLWPPALLALVIFAAAALSAVLMNDIICLAMVPILVEGCARRGLSPIPFLLGLASATNVGSAATLIGNPQNILVGQALHLSFSGYLAVAALPVLSGLVVVWAVIAWLYRGKWYAQTPVPSVKAPAFDLWQTTKGMVVVGGVLTVFLLGSPPREVVALTAAGVLLTSRRMASRDILALVDWQLLALFIGLFVVNRALVDSGRMEVLLNTLATYGVDLARPGVLCVATALLSNVVSNVPAVMLLLPSATYPAAGPILALASTLAGNFLIVGSIANVIVVDQAKALGVEITPAMHARAGIPVTLVTLALAWGWLTLVS